MERDARDDVSETIGYPNDEFDLDEIGSLEDSGSKIDEECDSPKFKKSSTITFNENVDCPN